MYGKLYSCQGWFPIDTSTNLPIETNDPEKDYGIRIDRKKYIRYSRTPKSVIKKLTKEIISAAQKWKENISDSDFKAGLEKIIEQNKNSLFDSSDHVKQVHRFAKDIEEWNERTKNRFHENMNIFEYTAALAQQSIDNMPYIQDYIKRQF